MNIIDLKRRWFREAAEKRPEFYKSILDHECPDAWGLPSYRDTRSCPDKTCEQCWKEALGDAAKAQNKNTE